MAEICFISMPHAPCALLTSRNEFECIMKRLLVASAGLLVIVLWLVAMFSQPAPSFEVTATMETEPVPSVGDAADDAAVWFNEQDPAQSAIIGTDKDSGLAVYDLFGRELQFVPHGEMNNVDLRDDFPLGNERVTLVTAGNQSDSTLAIYRLEAHTRKLESVAARAIKTCPPYGSCMYRSPLTGKFYYFVNSRVGEIEQWELYDNGLGKVDAMKVRAFHIGMRPEGCVADDELAFFYLGVEEEGIRKYGAEPEAGEHFVRIDSTRGGGHVRRQVEGLAIYYSTEHTGYLLASSQGNNAFVIYRREGNNDYVATFKIAANDSIDEVTHTDGIDVASHNFGEKYPLGFFVAQDDTNEADNQNFKIVSWHQIQNALATGVN